jgi:hypothetical protein
MEICEIKKLIESVGPNSPKNVFEEIEIMESILNELRKAQEVSYFILTELINKKVLKWSKKDLPLPTEVNIIGLTMGIEEYIDKLKISPKLFNEMFEFYKHSRKVNETKQKP